MNILQLTMHFRPNIGGLETHLDDLCKELIDKQANVFVLTYCPLETKTTWKLYERNKQLEILRIPWLKGVFYKLVKYPFLEFLYLMLGIFILTPIIIISRRIQIIHAHGISAGFIGVFWGKIFSKKVIISTHSIYNFPKTGLYKKFVLWIFNNSSLNLTLSNQSKMELLKLGVKSKKISRFTYWIDLQKFKKINNAKKIIKWTGFNVIFVGRLVVEKGLDGLLNAAKSWDKKITLYIVGVGPLENDIYSLTLRYKNIHFLGIIKQDKLPLYYSGADLLIIPSCSPEGFGRVIMESIACGTPVIGSKIGGISEAMDKTVGKLINNSSENIRKEVEFLYKHPKILKRMAVNCRRFALTRFSSKNAQQITNIYK